MKKIYIIISRTPTRFGSVIRKLGKVKYNHASVALDPQLNEIYAFARLRHNTLLLAWLMRENLDRFTLRKHNNINVTVFAIPVSEEQYDRVRLTIDTIRSDPQYMYNYLSVLSFPMFHGFETYKAYSCIEFVMHILNDDLDISAKKPLCSYTPDDLLTFLESYVLYCGNLLDYCKKVGHVSTPDSDYFSPLTFALVAKSLVSFGHIFTRLFHAKNRQ